MANPYLNRGESIILTTHRISVDSVLYNVMLTSERLILLDDRYATFQPRSIMLQDIDTLRSGKIPSGEPVIILSFTSSEKNQEPINLVFLLQYGENRKEERDEWVKKIMELRIALIPKETPAEIPPTNNKQGIHPSVRHWIAPETIRPLSTLRNLQPEPVPFTIIPDNPDSSSTTSPESEDHLHFTSPMEPPSSEPLKPSPIRKIEPEPADQEVSAEPATEEIPGAEKEPEQYENESDQSEPPVEPPILPDFPSNIIERPVIRKIEQESADQEVSAEPVTEEIPGVEKEPEQFENESDQSEPPLEPPILSDSPSNIIEWPVIRKIEPESADEESSAQPATEEIPGVEKEPEQFENESDQSEPPLEPPILSDSPSNIIEWPIIRKNEPESADEESSAQPATEEIPGTIDERGLSNIVSLETDPESFRTSITRALESLTTPGETDISSDRSPSIPIGENPAEKIELPPTETPLTQQLPEPSVEGEEKTGGTSLPEIATPRENSEMSQQLLTSIPEQAVPDPEEKSVQMRQSAPPLFSGGERFGKKTILVVGCIVLSILVIAGGLMILSSYSQKDIAAPPVSVIPTTPFVTTKITLSPVLIPQSGLWVRVNSSGPYLGQAGNPNMLKPVSGTGNQLYKIQNSNGIVQVDIKKQDNSGSSLSVEIYKDGYLLASRTVTAPMGSIDLLIDSKTGTPPGLYANGSRIL